MVAFSDIRDVRAAWQDQWEPALREHKPEMIFISAGFDAHTKDPLSQTNWQTEDFYWLTEAIKTLANELCQGRIVSILEGGYHLEALADSAEVHIRSLVED
jgi:acetoin utilization deacetylase AcuC-like enzyme